MTSHTWRITISPDPTRIVNKAQKRSYIACTTKEQYCIIKHGLKKATDCFLSEYQCAIDVHYEVYFELNKAGMLHCHGIIILLSDEEEISTEHIMFFQRMILRTLGREYIKGNPKTFLQAVMDYQDSEWEPLTTEEKNAVGGKTTRTYETWEEYCLKEQSQSWIKRYPCLKEQYMVRKNMKQTMRYIDLDLDKEDDF